MSGVFGEISPLIRGVLFLVNPACAWCKSKGQGEKTFDQLNEDGFIGSVRKIACEMCAVSQALSLLTWRRALLIFTKCLYIVGSSTNGIYHHFFFFKLFIASLLLSTIISNSTNTKYLFSPIS